MKKFLALLSFVVPLMLWADNEGESDPLSTMRVLFNDDTKLDIPFSENPQIIFDGPDDMTSINIVTSSQTYELCTDQVKDLMFLLETASIKSPNAVDGGEIEFIDGDLLLHVSERSEIVVYDLMGKAVARTDAAPGSNRISLSNLPFGVYIISFASYTVKFTKQ
ncbi:MAG: T9SS type A sorting domain-containing protein [Clostridium sp.]|nr:T9SS type A sorting domain-containing protein [Clostridium sp.]